MGEQAKRELMVSNARESRKHIQKVQYKAREGRHNTGRAGKTTESHGEQARARESRQQARRAGNRQGARRQEPGRAGKSQVEQARSREGRQQARRTGKVKARDSSKSQGK